jgi:hypothetical protein
MMLPMQYLLDRFGRFDRQLPKVISSPRAKGESGFRVGFTGMVVSLSRPAANGDDMANWRRCWQRTVRGCVRMTDVQPEAASRRGRRGRAGNGNSASSSSARRGPGGRQPAEQVLVELEPLVSALIKENRELRRQLDKLSRQPVGAAPASVERALRSLERRVRTSLNGGARGGRQRSSTSSSSSTPRRRVTNPELLERRRQALAKAREARAAKRAAAEQ